jgi:hypothetical protein
MRTKKNGPAGRLQTADGQLRVNVCGPTEQDDHMPVHALTTAGLIVFAGKLPWRR